MERKSCYFVTGIDTGIGKSIATGVLAREWRARGERIITQKFIQTGCEGISEDIALHRRLMGIPLQPEDLDGTTCPLVFSYPASPRLAAERDGRSIDLGLISRATGKLLTTYDTVLCEGAGGLFVPLTDDYFTIDYIVECDIPVILVASSRLGSINHTVLSLEACRARGITVAALIYNLYPPEEEPIVEDTRCYLKQYLDRHFPGTDFQQLDDRLSLSAV